jgi:tetratricopeptide (TPR) repeat protein
LALFKKNKDGETPNGGDDHIENSTGSPDEAFSESKAQGFFKHARAAHDSFNYAYAMTLWLNGLRQYPMSMEGLEGFLSSAMTFNGSEMDEKARKKALKEARQGVNGKGRQGKYVLSLFDFGTNPTDLGAALKAAENAAALTCREAAQYIATHAFKLAAADPKRQKKDVYVRLMDAFENIEAYDLAVQAGNSALILDRADGELANRVRNLGAKATMSKGGYEDVGQEGGFRKNIRDAEKQRQLQEAEQISKTQDVKDRLVAEAEAAYNERPDDVPTIERYGKALRDRGKNADELKAMALYTKAFQETGQYKFRQMSGDIQIRRARREVSKARQALEAKPDNAEAQARVEKATKALLDLEISELTLRVEKYPTDLSIKYELGRRFAQAGRYNEAIEQFQLAQEDAKIRRHVLFEMANSFMQLGGWLDEAIETYRSALDGLADEKSDLGMEIRYGLMAALHEKGETTRDLGAAEEADKLAAGIAIQSFGYKDIRERRDKIKTLINDLKDGS